MKRREVMVVPIREEAFAAARKIHVYAVPIVRSTSDVDYIAFYRGAPTSAITHYAKVDIISKNRTFSQVFPRGSEVLDKEDRPMKVYNLSDLVELRRRVKKGRNPPISGPRYTNLADLRKARYLDEVWPPEDPGPKGRKEGAAVEPKPEPGGRPEEQPATGKEGAEPKKKRRKRGGRKTRSGDEAKEEAPKAEAPPAEPQTKRKKRGSRKKKTPIEGETQTPSVHYIVDGSNVALEARTFKEGGRLNQLELVVDKLSTAKDAAVTVIVDANLRHHIDRKDDLEKMIKERKVLQAPAQTDADEFILQTAESLRTRGESVIIVSNDRYKDYIKKYKPRFDWVQDSQQQFMFVFSHDGAQVLEAIISLP